MNNKKNINTKKMDANNTMKITYHGGTIENESVYVYFTGSTLSEILDVVKRYYNGLRRDTNCGGHVTFDLYWFDDERSKIIINHNDGVKIFMERTSRLKTRHLHVQPSVIMYDEYDGGRILSRENFHRYPYKPS